MKNPQVKLGVSVLLSFSFIVLLVQNVFACSPAGPDPWFATKLSFDKSSLPSGIEIVQTDPTYEPYALINKNSEPFYLVREINPVLLSPAYGNEYRFPNSGLPDGYEPRFKITSSQVYFWGQLSSQDTKEWKPDSGGINNSSATRVRIDEGIYTLDGESRQIYQDNRPEVLDIPTSQNFKILGFYRGTPIEITGTLSYSLNENYDPQGFAKGVKDCNDFDKWGVSFSLLPILVLVSFVGLIVLVVYKVIKATKVRRKY